MYVNEVLETCLCLEIMLKLFALCLEVIVFDTLHVTSKTCGTLFPLSLSLHEASLFVSSRTSRRWKEVEDHPNCRSVWCSLNTSTMHHVFIMPQRELGQCVLIQDLPGKRTGTSHQSVHVTGAIS